jgi:molybdopterin/thiamine biosynthesis adenylyltransferase
MKTSIDSPVQSKAMLVPQLAEGQTVKVIGLGGVGGILIRYLCLFLASLGRNVRVVLIDGDTFDPTTNATRMFFAQPGNKAAVVREELLSFFDAAQLTLSAVEEYANADNLRRLIHEGDIVFLCVDNHHTRLLVNDHCAHLADVSLFSGGNDGVGEDSAGVYRRGTFGNVQVFLRRDGHDACPSLAQFHPEIAHPADKNPVDASCVELMASVPQILPANLQTASALLSTFWLTLCGALDYSELVFDIADASMGPLPLPGPKRF